MKESILQQKSKEFALKIINLTQSLQNKNQYILSNQILRSGTSIGANIAEGAYAVSKADFTNKYQIAQKEASETKYWLELLYESKQIENETYEILMGDLMYILKMLAKSILTCKSNK